MAINTGNMGLVNAPVQIPPKLDISLTIGEALERFLQRVLFVIENTPSKIIREIGEQLVFFIKALQEAYDKSSGKTLNHVDQILRDRLSQIDLIIRQMEERNFSRLQQLITEGLQQVVSSSIFGTNYPFIRTFSPASIITSQTHEFVIEFFGTFPQAKDTEFKPQLTFNGHAATLTENGDVKLSFRMSVVKAFDQNDVTSGMLIIPYSQYVRFNRGSVSYQFEVQKLPKFIGTITVETSTPETPTPKYEKKESPLFQLNSRKKYGGQDLQHVCPLAVTPGRKMVYGSQNITWIKNSGRNSFSVHEVTERGVSFLAKTFRNTTKDSHSGKLYFTIHFQEYAVPDPIFVPKVIPVELECGGSKVVEVSKTWKVIFQPFDGFPTQEFSAANFDDPYIKIAVEGSNLRLSTKEVAKLKHFQTVKKLKIANTEPTSLIPLLSIASFRKISYPVTFVAGAVVGYVFRSRL